MNITLHRDCTQHFMFEENSKKKQKRRRKKKKEAERNGKSGSKKGRIPGSGSGIQRLFSDLR